jgi:hypothetical protein
MGELLYKRTQRERVRIFGSVLFEHQFALQQLVTAVAMYLATTTISDAGLCDHLSNRLAEARSLYGLDHQNPVDRVELPS